jgi:hypothetical protein
MKKIIAVLLIVIFTLSLASCSDKYDDIKEQLNIMQRPGYSYTEEQISELKSQYEIKEKITGFTNYSYVDVNNKEIFLYVMEFENEEEAESYLNNHAKLWKYAYRSDNVVVYGNDGTINDLDL